MVTRFGRHYYPYLSFYGYLKSIGITIDFDCVHDSLRYISGYGTIYR